MSIGAVIMVFPFVWMVLGSFKPRPEVVAYPIKILPEHPTFENYLKVFDRIPILRYIINSSICTAYQVTGAVFLSSLAGFTFAKIRFPYRNLIFLFVLVTMFTPIQTRLIPLYFLIFKLNLIDTYHGIVLPAMIGPVIIFLMRQAMLGVPDDLVDAARIDGCSLFGIYWKIALPLCRPMVVTLAIFSFVWSWTAFLWPIIVINRQEMRTIELGLAMFRNVFFVEYELTMAVSTIAVIPTLAFFFFMQKHIISSIARTGLKG